MLQRSCNTAIITEGPLDVILATKYGLSNVLATLGTSFTEEHAAFLKEKRLEPIISYDGDSAGQKATKNAVMICKEMGITANVCVLPTDQDMADMAVALKGELSAFVEDNTIPGWQFLLNNAVTLYDAGVHKLRQRIMSDITQAIPVNEEDRTLMASFVKERFGILL